MNTDAEEHFNASVLSLSDNWTLHRILVGISTSQKRMSPDSSSDNEQDGRIRLRVDSSALRRQKRSWNFKVLLQIAIQRQSI